MHSLNNEVEKRMQSNNWSEEMAERVISEKKRRTRNKITLAGSLFVGLIVFTLVGLNIFHQKSAGRYWSNYFTSAVEEYTDIDLVPSDIDEFIATSFEGE